MKIIGESTPQSRQTVFILLRVCTVTLLFFGLVQIFGLLSAHSSNWKPTYSSIVQVEEAKVNALRGLAMAIAGISGLLLVNRAEKRKPIKLRLLILAPIVLATVLAAILYSRDQNSSVTYFVEIGVVCYDQNYSEIPTLQESKTLRTDTIRKFETKAYLREAAARSACLYK